MKKGKIIVTGGAGFIGRYTVKRLREEGYEVFSVDIRTELPGTKFLDVTDFQMTSKLFAELRPNIVIHLAALAGSTGRGGGAESLKDPFNYFRVNMLGTLCIFEACKLHGVNRIIHMSSFSPYGVPENPICEETPFRPNNPYGYSKACAESIAESYATTCNINTIVFRAPLVCGKGQKELNALREFVLSANQSKPITIFGSGMHIREWLHPTDVAEAFLLAIEYFEKMKDTYEVFVLGSKPTSMLELGKLVIQTVGSGSIEFHPSTRSTFDQFTNTSKVRQALRWRAQVSVKQIVEEVTEECRKTLVN